MPTGSKAFTENLRKTVGSRASVLFSYFRNLATTDEPFDVVILDEAHRIREVSTNRFTPKHQQTGKPQIEEIFDAGRISVFFIDDRQVVRPGEVGSTELIREAVGQREIPLQHYRLEAQFRANGSDAFIQWVDSTLAVAKTPQVLWPRDDPFDVRIVDDVEELDRLIRVTSAGGPYRPTRRGLLLAMVQARAVRRPRDGRGHRRVATSVERPR